MNVRQHLHSRYMNLFNLLETKGVVFYDAFTVDATSFISVLFMLSSLQRIKHQAVRTNYAQYSYNKHH